MSKTENKTRWFLVPNGIIGAFFTKLEDSRLNYELAELEEDKLKVEVEYDHNGREVVMSLIELLDEYEQETEEE